MAKTITASIFPVNNSEGEDFARRVREQLTARGFKVSVYEQASATDYLRACVADDLVVLDASLETGHNYAIAAPHALDHVLVVGRTYLPLNFYGLREGGTPDFPHPKHQSNLEILGWLENQLLELMPTFPRKGKTLLKHFKEMGRSLELLENRRKLETEIFISYRSRWFGGVSTLASQLRRNGSNVYFLPPGRLVYDNEVLSAMRHWQLASMIDWRIGSAREIWIYDTEDYLGSWWTQVELVTMSYRRRNMNSIQVLAPATHTVHPAPARYLPRLTQKDQKRMARWYANCDPAQMGPESVLALRMISKIPLVGRLAFFRDQVWTKEFWDYPLIPCPSCQSLRRTETHLHIHNILSLQGYGLFQASPEELDNATRGRGLICPRCSAMIRIRRDPYSRFIWRPPINRAIPILEEMPIYRSEPVVLRRS